LARVTTASACPSGFFRKSFEGLNNTDDFDGDEKADPLDG